MYASTTQPYGAAPSGPAGPYRGSPVQGMGMPRQAYAAGPGQQQAAMYAQAQAAAQQQRYPQAGYVMPGQGVPPQGMPVMSPPGQFQQPGYGYTSAPQHGQGQPKRQHKGTIPPGQLVRVGKNTVRVERYLSEGGYAHVYLTTSEKPIYPPQRANASRGRWGEKGYTEHCLKRIAFEDENVWIDVSKEIEVMKSLPPSPHLVQYLDSSHHRLPNGAHEVFILMEFCSGGGIIDLLNKRLRDRLKEIEILNIFTDVCEAVAAMHALPRPLLHRDLKIENVLSHPNGQPPGPQRPTPLVFKLCDFGSTTFPASHPPTTKAEADALAMDLNKHTTLQYRSPEMVEPMLGWPVGLPSDVWALGVLLYKLCYYTTPFEEHGTLAIVNAKYTFPQYPVYSPRIQHLIASMLVEHPTRRPSVFDVLKLAHDMSDSKPLVDYPTGNRLPATLSASPAKQHRPQPSNTANVLDFTDSQSPPPPPELPLAATIQPQRRGRPTKGQPPPPHLPATVSPAPVPIQSSRSEAPQPSHTTSSSVSATSASSHNRIQVTGESGQPSKAEKPRVAPKPSLEKLQSAGITGGSSRPTPSPSGSVDAFGAPKAGTQVASPSGFGDAFGVTLRATKTSSSSASGFGDSFTGGKFSRQPPPPSLPSGTEFTDSFSGQRPPSVPASAKREFSDSFNGQLPLQPTVASSKAKPSSPTSPKEITLSPVQTSIEKRSAEPSPIPDGELSFETRFPSIETLDAEKPAPAPRKASPPAEKAAETKEGRKMSIVTGNHTGGDLGSSIRSPKAGREQLPPQPRSTHVTGTAFKSAVRAPSPEVDDSSTADYLNLLDDEVEKSPSGHVDLLGDEESESMRVALAPLRPVLSQTPSSGSRFGVSPSPQSATLPQQPKQEDGQTQKPTVPPLKPDRPASNFNSANWSPLERMRSESLSSKTPTSPTQSKINGSQNAEADSSDDEQVPENVNGMGRRPSPPAYSNSLGLGRPTSNTSRRSPNSSAGSRPQSMYVGSTSPAMSPPLIPGVPRSSPPADNSKHMRRSSINDIVSRYESLTTNYSGQKSQAKPSVAAKPTNLSGFRPPAVPPSIAPKPELLRRPSGGRPMPSTSNSGLRRAASVSSRPPATAPKPAALHATPDGVQSNPGTSHRVDKSSGNQQRELEQQQRPSPPIRSNSAAPSSRSSSPEKQQPVSVMIARWNKGQK